MKVQKRKNERVVINSSSEFLKRLDIQNASLSSKAPIPQKVYGKISEQSQSSTVILDKFGKDENENLKGLEQVLLEAVHGQSLGEGVLPIMAYTSTVRLRPKGVPFSDFRYIKG